MPIKVPNGLPAARQLLEEGVFVMEDMRAKTQDIRPLQVAVLNLMPQKLKTELQLARLMGNSPLQIELTLLAPASYTGTNTSAEHLLAYYKTWAEVKDRCFDALVITGAPVEHLPFEEVKYWPELCEIFEWSTTHVFSSFALCWAAQAALYHFHGIGKHVRDEKLFGLYPYATTPQARKHPLLRGFDDVYMMPVSRFSETREAEIAQVAEIQVLAASETLGAGLMVDAQRRYMFMLNHLEYDGATLGEEYQRDVDAGKTPALPLNYFPGNDPTQTPLNVWRSHAQLLFANWLNDVYQRTPYVVDDIRHIGE